MSADLRDLHRRPASGEKVSDTFDFLGFTLHRGRSGRGWWALKAEVHDGGVLSDHDRAMQSGHSGERQVFLFYGPPGTARALSKSADATGA